MDLPIEERPVFRTCLLLATLFSGATLRAAEPVDYSIRIQPIFQKHCYECHGPDKKESGLRLDLRQEALAGGQSGPAIVPSDPDGSLLLKLVQSADPEKVMPPKGDPLTPEEIKLLKEWIEAGANWPEE
jgi:mono/diheme cytochrome c family protein